jgi:hypothetical protein
MKTLPHNSPGKPAGDDISRHPVTQLKIATAVPRLQAHPLDETAGFG